MSLFPFIGLDESDDLRIYISPFKLHKLSAMHSRGKPFPDGCDSGISPEKTRELLQKLCNYYNEYEGGKKSKKK